MKQLIILLLVVFTTGVVCAKDVKKPVSQSTSKENAIRKQNFNMCIQQTGSRSKCYYLWY